MGLFNTVTVDEVCENCHSAVNRRVQFKYGDVRLHQYRIGDSLEWDGNKIGRPGLKRVRVSGFPEQCPVCKFEPTTMYEVTIERDRIVSVRPVGREDQEIELFGEGGVIEED